MRDCGYWWRSKVNMTNNFTINHFIEYLTKSIATTSTGEKRARRSEKICMQARNRDEPFCQTLVRIRHEKPGPTYNTGFKIIKIFHTRSQYFQKFEKVPSPLNKSSVLKRSLFPS